MHGQFVKENQLNFTGIINHNCSGTVNFPGQIFPRKSFKYYEEEYKIVWGNQQTGEVWNKGNNLSNLIFIQIKYVPYYRNHETNHEKKKSINSENIALSLPLHVKMKNLKITAVKKYTILST